MLSGDFQPRPGAETGDRRSRPPAPDPAHPSPAVFLPAAPPVHHWHSDPV